MALSILTFDVTLDSRESCFCLVWKMYKKFEKIPRVLWHIIHIILQKYGYLINLGSRKTAAGSSQNHQFFMNHFGIWFKSNWMNYVENRFHSIGKCWKYYKGQYSQFGCNIDISFYTLFFWWCKRMLKKTSSWVKNITDSDIVSCERNNKRKRRLQYCNCN
jgi:hypothetical protein